MGSYLFVYVKNKKIVEYFVTLAKWSIPGEISKWGWLYRFLCGSIPIERVLLYLFLCSTRTTHSECYLILCEVDMK